MSFEQEKSNHEITPHSEKSIFDGLEGVYRGFSPTDKSGELELTITKAAIKFRMATGLEIQEVEIQVSEIEISELSEGEVNGLYDDSSDTQGVRVFRVGRQPWFVFNRDEGDGASVSMCTSVAAHLGPTVLFTPRQVKEGFYEKVLREIELEFGQIGVIPRLSNEGKPLN